MALIMIKISQFILNSDSLRGFPKQARDFQEGKLTVPSQLQCYQHVWERADVSQMQDDEECVIGYLSRVLCREEKQSFVTLREQPAILCAVKHSLSRLPDVYKIKASLEGIVVTMDEGMCQQESLSPGQMLCKSVCCTVDRLTIWNIPISVSPQSVGTLSQLGAACLWDPRGYASWSFDSW